MSFQSTSKSAGVILITRFATSGQSDIVAVSFNTSSGSTL